jgi:hypothetical protein
MFDWMNEKIKRLDCFDIFLIKLSVFFFTMLLIKTFPFLSLISTKLLVVLFILSMIRPMVKYFRK